MLHPFVQQKLPQALQLFAEHKIKHAYAFGSAVTDNFSKTSDVDFLVAFEEEADPLVSGERWWDLYFKLQELFERDVDLLSEEQINNPYLLQSINSNKILIYGAGN